MTRRAMLLCGTLFSTPRLRYAPYTAVDEALWFETENRYF